MSRQLEGKKDCVVLEDKQDKPKPTVNVQNSPATEPFALDKISVPGGAASQPER